MKKIKRSNHLYISAGKTTNVYKVSVEHYHQLLHSNIPSNYRKVGAKDNTEIDMEAKIVAKELTLDDRVKYLAQRDDLPP